MRCYPKVELNTKNETPKSEEGSPQWNEEELTVISVKTKKKI